MKIIAVDRYARQWIADQLIIADYRCITQELTDNLNDNHSYGELYYRLVSDDYPLYSPKSENK